MPGSKNNPVSAVALIYAVLGSAHAQDTARPADDEKASLELLEFLGEWRTAKGEFIDPIELQDPNEPAAASAPKVEGEKHD
jgi:hypothetical protein